MSCSVAIRVTVSLSGCRILINFLSFSFIQGEQTFGIISDVQPKKNYIVLRKILEAGDDGGVEAVRKAIDLYTSCLNTTEIDSLGAKPLQQLIEELGIK